MPMPHVGQISGPTADAIFHLLEEVEALKARVVVLETKPPEPEVYGEKPAKKK